MLEIIGPETKENRGLIILVLMGCFDLKIIVGLVKCLACSFILKFFTYSIEAINIFFWNLNCQNEIGVGSKQTNNFSQSVLFSVAGLAVESN